MKTRILFTLLTFVLTGSAFAQSKQEKAREKNTEAVRLLDNGEIDKAIDLLEDCVKLDQGTYRYNYNLGYAYAEKENHKKALVYLKKAIKADDATDRCYLTYGEELTASGDPEGAVAAYDDGIKRFPHAGILYTARGNVHAAKDEYGKALVFYEKGIEMDPEFATNYVVTATIYCMLSEEEVWGMIYGELYLNMADRKEEWADQISQILYNTYASEITFPTDSTAAVSFSKGEIMITDMSQLENLQLPFPMIAYETSLTVGAMFEKSIDLASLNNIRSNFLGMYYGAGHDKTFPNILFEYQQKVKEAGHMEAYNYWILKSGDTAGFLKWQSANMEKWDAFVAWHAENPLTISPEHRFYRKQY